MNDYPFGVICGNSDEIVDQSDYDIGHHDQHK